MEQPKSTELLTLSSVGKLVFDQRFPVPKEPTFAVCELNNGLEHVVTGAARLGKDTNISQEFEL